MWVHACVQGVRECACPACVLVCVGCAYMAQGRAQQHTAHAPGPWAFATPRQGSGWHERLRLALLVCACIDAGPKRHDVHSTRMWDWVCTSQALTFGLSAMLALGQHSLVSGGISVRAKRHDARSCGCVLPAQICTCGRRKWGVLPCRRQVPPLLPPPPKAPCQDGQGTMSHHVTPCHTGPCSCCWPRAAWPWLCTWKKAGTWNARARRCWVTTTHATAATCSKLCGRTTRPAALCGQTRRVSWSTGTLTRWRPGTAADQGFGIRRSRVGLLACVYNRGVSRMPGMRGLPRVIGQCRGACAWLCVSKAG